MKKYQFLGMGTLVLVIVLVGFSVAAQDYSRSLCDYDQPMTLYQDLGLELQYHYYDDPAIGTQGDINRSSAFGNYQYIFSTPNYSLNLNSNSFFSLTMDDVIYEASGVGRYNVYMPDSDLFAFGGVSLDLSSSFSEQAGVRVSTGTGYGRFKNVAPLVKATLISELLREQGALSAELSDSTVDQIAQEIGKLGPGKGIDEVVTDVVSIIEGSPALQGDKLGAVEVLRIRETIQEVSDQRLCGWEIRGGLGYEVLDPQGGKRDFLVNTAARYARPFTPYSQLSIGVDFSSPFEFGERYNLSGAATYSYRFLENLDARLRYYFFFHQGEILTTYHQSVSATAEVQLQRDLSTAITFSLTDGENYAELEKEITLGLTYNVL